MLPVGLLSGRTPSKLIQTFVRIQFLVVVVLRSQFPYWRHEEKGTTEDEMVGWHHRLDGHEFEQTLGVDDGQGGLVCFSPWGHKESDTTERLN